MKVVICKKHNYIQDKFSIDSAKIKLFCPTCNNEPVKIEMGRNCWYYDYHYLSVAKRRSIMNVANTLFYQKLEGGDNV